MLHLRSSGILLHPTSLPGRFGIGDLGKEAYAFIDFLAQSHQKIWQVLPLGPTGFGNSPYLSYSAFAGNPLLINLEWLVAENLLSEDDLNQLPHFSEDQVDFDLVIAHKIPLLRKASHNFDQVATPQRKQAFEAFCQEHQY
jgi:4-alpha-glucanotransferase